MNSTRVLQAAHRTPLIKFLGKRTAPKSIDHTPTPHPASPEHSLPESFASYRAKAQQHGPLGGHQQQRTSSQPSSSQQPTQRIDAHAYGGIGGKSGHSLGSVVAPEGMFFDRSELPERFRRTSWEESEMEAVTSGGASMW